MPILLDDLASSAKQIKTYSPKFFDQKLTGNGKGIGVLNANLDPAHIKPGQPTTSEHRQAIHRKYTNGQTDVRIIPVNPLGYNAWSYMDKIRRPNMDSMVCVLEAPNSPTEPKVYFTMRPHSIVMEETHLPAVPAQNITSRIQRSVTICYHAFLVGIADGKDEYHAWTGAPANLVNVITNTTQPYNHAFQTIPMSSGNAYFAGMTCDPVTWANDQITAAHIALGPGYDLHNQELADYFQNYCVYDAMCARSEQWQTTIDDILLQYFQNIAGNKQYASNNVALNEVARTLTYLENYPVPLNLCRKIYQDITATFPADKATTLCKQNLNLLLSDTLNNLDKNKASIPGIPAIAPGTALPPSVQKLSREQHAAVTSADPLILVQSGAGTGKSTTILSRVDYMIACGVKPEDIMVLSFTNAAADHIKDKNPDIHSMTIARMIHTIYSENFPNHELSTLDTIINSLEIYYPDDDLAIRFKKRCLDVKNNQTGAFIRINSFVEMHYDAVIAMLDTIRQTSLELEIIICYQQIDYLKEPDEVKSKYLIIDEVQDNSIFEFVYTLRYVRKHNESLFIVGDCSQTLFEFRGSEPKALNVMEGSGVFTTFQLQVNYRSNQEILDFANVLLQKIEANQYAQIQLQANALATVTEQSFTDKVKLHYARLNKQADLPNMLPTIFANTLRAYMDQKLAAGQQIAFLAHTRHMVGMIQTHLEKLYPTRKIVNMIPEKSYNSTVFSMFIRKYWDTIGFVPTKNITDVIENAILSNVENLISRMDKQKAMAIAITMITKWKLQYQADIDGWTRAYLSGAYTLAQLMDNVKACMLDFEINMNAVKQKMVSLRNEQAKQNQDIQTADFLLSTIHSAKGLEFDNVVVFYNNNVNQLEESDKRMYYVAFTRAMLSEFIVAYGTVANPRVEMDYKFIVDQLHAKHPIVTAAAQPVAAMPAAPAAAPAQEDPDQPILPVATGDETSTQPAPESIIGNDMPVTGNTAAAPTDAVQSALGACGYTFAQSPSVKVPDEDKD